MPEIEKLKKRLSLSALTAKRWFMEESSEKSRKDYFSVGMLGDPGTGAVYVYFDKDGCALYVGESGRPIKRRMHDEKSPHKKAPWWSEWHTVRLLPQTHRTDRIALEMLLVLAFQPAHNTKPGKRDICEMFGNEP